MKPRNLAKLSERILGYKQKGREFGAARLRYTKKSSLIEE